MRTTTASILAVAAIVLRPSTTAADSFDEALALVPKDVAGAFVVPNLKKSSDDLDACLERVDRAEALLVGRPLDLLKAQLGASVGVRDDGALVGFLRWPAGQAEPTTTLLVPVTDAEAFLRGSFEPDGAGQTPPAVVDADGARTVRRPDGTNFWALALHVGAEPTRRTWVALSPERPGVAGLAAEAGAAVGHRALLGAGGGAEGGAGAGASGERLLQHADLLAWIDGATIRRLAADRAALAAASLDPQGRAAAARAAAKADELLAGVQVAATTWNVDALGLFGRGVIRIDPASQLGSLFAGAADATDAGGGTQDRFDRLPDQPFYAAVGIDVEGLGGPAAIKALEAIGLPEQLPGAAEALGALSRWSDGVHEAQLAIFPSKLGITVGGILNDAALALRTSDPAALRDRIQTAMESLVGDGAGVLRSLSWERDKQIKESGTADAFELKESPSPTQPRDVDLQSAVIKGLALGNRGWHGLMKPFADSNVLVATFSQRPDVWRRATAAATGAAAPLGRNATIVAMREFGIADPDVEFALGLTQLVKLAQQVAKTFPGGEGLVPALDAGTEPIYAALEASPDQLEGAWVLPSAIVGLAIDQAKRSQPAPAPAPAPAPGP